MAVTHPPPQQELEGRTGETDSEADDDDEEM